MVSVSTELQGYLSWRSTVEKNISLLQFSFHDLSIPVEENKFNTTIYDKRNTFPLSTVLMHYNDGNLSSRTFYEWIASENSAFLQSVTKIVRLAPTALY